MIGALALIVFALVCEVALGETMFGFALLIGLVAWTFHRVRSGVERFGEMSEQGTDDVDEDERKDRRNRGYAPGPVHEEQRRDKESRGFTADPHKAVGGRPEDADAQDLEAQDGPDGGDETTEE